MVKNEVLGRIRRSEGYGSIRLGPENRLAGSAKFLLPDFQKAKIYPPSSTYIVILPVVITYGPPGAGDREVGGCIRNCPAHVFLFSCLPLPALPSSSFIFPLLPSSSVASLLLFPSSPLRPCPLLSLLSPPPPSRLCTPSLLPSPSLLTVPSPFFHPSSSLSLLTPCFACSLLPIPCSLPYSTEFSNLPLATLLAKLFQNKKEQQTKSKRHLSVLLSCQKYAMNAG